MWGLSRRVVSLLFAATSSQLDRYSPESTKQISTDFRNFYDALGEKVAVFKEVSPTVKFSFVTPPGYGSEENWYDDDVVHSDAHMMEGVTDEEAPSDTTIFERVSSKYAAKEDDTSKPIALYLPGLDGFGLSSAGWQFNDLSNTFEMWRMSVSTTDRSSFGELLKFVSNFVDELASTTDRPIYIIAESMSGLLAPGLALKLQNREKRGGAKNPISGLVLVNPATSFGDSNWDVTAPLLTTLGYLTSEESANDNASGSSSAFPSPYALFGGLTLARLIPSSSQFDRIVEKLLPISNFSSPSEIGDYVEGFSEMMSLVSEKIPPELLEHRLNKWLMVGESLVNPRLSQLNLPVLVVAGSNDNLLGSRSEANRLQKVIPNCEKLLVSGGGHFVLDENVNLTEAIIYSKSLDPLNLNKVKTYDPIADWKLPSRSIIKEVFEKSVAPMMQSHSPIFISTDSRGVRSMGLGNLPKSEGPLLFVSNHQFLGSDLNMVIGKFIENGLIVRGLAHPITFSGPQRDELGGRTPGLTPQKQDSSVGFGSNSFDVDTGSMFLNFRRFGAVPVTPKNYYRLLETGQNALLFPGGIREAYHRKEEANKVMWPGKVDFIRIAARFNATIVPFSSVGMAESYNSLLEADEVANLPVLSDAVNEFADSVPAARFDMKPEEENFVPPLAIPGIPSRNYFLFEKAISTTDIDPKDKEACRQVYEEIRDTIQGGLDELVKARETDPFYDTPRRLAYERLTGTKAPTFDIEQLR